MSVDKHNGDFSIYRVEGSQFSADVSMHSIHTKVAI